nr:hypothetical protein [uncultured Butyricimonas sp.]
MVTITVIDSESNQEMILSINNAGNETATVNVKFNPPLEKEKQEYSKLWDSIASRVMKVIKVD